MDRSRPGHMTRRRFLKTGAAAAAGLATLPAILHADAGSPYGSFTVGAQSYCFRNFDTEGALKRTHELGLRHIEFFRKHLPLDSTPEQVKAVLKLCAEYDVKPVSYGVESFDKDHDKNKKKFDFAREIGIKYISADPTPNSFDSLDKLVEEYRIAIAIHPHGPLGVGKLMHHWYCADVILAAVGDHSPLIGSCLDTGHLIRAAQLGKNLNPAEEIRKMGARNFGIHLKDHSNEKHTDVIYGQGALDVPAVLQALKDVKFKGWISIEYEAHPDNPVPDMQACLRILQEDVKKVG
jgi:sugar phosphate isomerase/epimerase